MFKGKKNNEKDGEQNLDGINEENMSANEARDLSGSIGKEDVAPQGLREFDPFEEIPTFTPGKPGFEEGTYFAGKFLRTKRVFSD